MSLKIWLPLNNNLNNQGLTDWNPSIQNNTTATYVNGKIGKALNTGGIIMPANIASQVLNNSEFSYACWLYVNGATDSTTERAMIFGNNSPRRFSMFQYPSANDFHWSWYDMKNGTDTFLCGSVLYDVLPSNQWTHIAVTYKNPNGKIYINGELKTTFTGNYTGGDFNYDTQLIHNSPYHYLNDVRLYNHCLSPKEVKQISQGLVLHYKLSDTFVEPTTNLITTEDCLSSTCYNASISKYSYGSATDMYKTVTTFDGRKGTKVYMDTSGNNCYPYVYVNNMFTSNGTNAPSYKTLSFDYYTTVSTSICPYKLGSGTGTATYIVRANGKIKTGTGTNSVEIPIIPNTWNHVEVTFHGTTDANAEWGYIQNRPAHVSDINNFWFFANMQLETKDHATGYAGIGGTRDGTDLIYDCSGFGYNGTKTNITINEDTLRYLISSYFEDGSKIQTNFNVPIGTGDFTVSVWVKMPLSTSKTYQPIFTTKGTGAASKGFGLYYNHNQNKFLWSTADGSSATEIWMSETISIYDTWTHVVMVRDSNDAKKGYFYLNGVRKELASVPVIRNINGHTGNLCIGSMPTDAAAYRYIGALSDFRIYATALSADDILTLYNTAATIDNQGNLFTYEVVEG